MFFWYFRISLSATVPGRYRCPGFFVPPGVVPPGVPLGVFGERRGMLALAVRSCGVGNVPLMQSVSEKRYSMGKTVTQQSFSDLPSIKLSKRLGDNIC